MQRLFCAKPLLAAAVVIGGLAAASAAHARSDVYFSVGVGVPYGYVQPGPVYVQPQPVYVQPQPVYVQPQPIYYQGGYHQGHRRGPWGDRDHDGVPNAYDRDNRHYGHYGHGYRDYRYRDADRDGVPNRYDRAPHNPYYR
ncbi:MAG TPA: PXPV repeat protein [Ramlibacter sp.]|nr:PXPV repeat protein [Ramlibacter sp.]